MTTKPITPLNPIASQFKFHSGRRATVEAMIAKINEIIELTNTHHKLISMHHKDFGDIIKAISADAHNTALREAQIKNFVTRRFIDPEIGEKILFEGFEPKPTICETCQCTVDPGHTCYQAAIPNKTLNGFTFDELRAFVNTLEVGRGQAVRQALDILEGIIASGYELPFRTMREPTNKDNGGREKR